MNEKNLTTYINHVFSAFSAEKVKCFRVKEKKGKIKRITVKEKKSCKGKWVAVDDTTKGLNKWMHRFKKECKDIQEKGSRTKKYTCEKSKANEICKNHIEKLDILTTKIPNLKAKIKKRKADGKKVPKSLPKKLEKIKKKIITLKSTKIPTACGHNDNAESTKIE